MENADDPIPCNPGTLTDPLPTVERAMAAFRRRVRGRPVQAYEHGREALGCLRVAAAAAFGGAPGGWAMADSHTATIDRISNVIGQLLGSGLTVASTFGEHIGGLGAFSADPRVRVQLAHPEALVDSACGVFFVSQLSYETNHDNTDVIRALVQRRDAPIVIVDGSQALGQVPVDVGALGCHAYIASGHKWLGGPNGTGLLYLRGDVIDEWPTPFRAGHPVCEDIAIGRWEPRGGQDFARVAGLVRAVEEFTRNGRRGMQHRAHFIELLECSLAAHVRVRSDSAPHGRVAAIEVPGRDVYDIYRALGARNVIVKCIKRPADDATGEPGIDVLRAGFPWWTTSAAVRELASVLTEILTGASLRQRCTDRRSGR